MSQKVASVLAILITAALVVVIFQMEPEPRLVERETSLPVVTVTKLRTHDVQPWQKFVGRFEPVRTSELKFEVSGRISARYIEAGVSVEKGTVLLTIDDEDYRDALAKADAQVSLVRAEIGRDGQLLELARDNMLLQEKEVARLKDLTAKGLAAQSSLDATRQKLVNSRIETHRLQHLVSVANARLELANSERDQAARKLQRTKLVAPFKGVVNLIKAEVGGYATSGQTALVVVDISQLDLLLHVNENVASELRIGKLIAIESLVSAASSVDLQGELVALQVAPDPKTYTYETRVRVPALDGLQAGMVAYANLPKPVRDDVITVPVSAVLYTDGRTYVFVEREGVVKRIRVSLGARVGDYAIVNSGLGAGLNVVTHDVDRLYDGQKAAFRRGVEAIH